jgi:hypothetical protein
MSKSLQVALHFCAPGPAFWAAQLGRPVVLRGPVWDLAVVPPSPVKELEGHQQTSTLVTKPNLL